MSERVDGTDQDPQPDRDQAERWEAEARILGREGAEAADLLAGALGYSDRYHTDAPLGTSILLFLARRLAAELDTARAERDEAYRRYTEQKTINRVTFQELMQERVQLRTATTDALNRAADDAERSMWFEGKEVSNRVRRKHRRRFARWLRARASTTEPTATTALTDPDGNEPFCRFCETAMPWWEIQTHDCASLEEDVDA